jgi:hypothetical protein
VTDRLERESQVRALIAAEPLGAQAHPANLPDWLQRLCVAAARAVPADGAAVTLETESGFRTVTAASEPLYAVLDELQTTLGQGPSVHAFATRSPALDADLGSRSLQAWPQFTQAARERGMAAAFALPLQVGAARLGTFSLYRRSPGSLARASLASALTFADIALERLLDAQALAEPRQDGHGLATALDVGFDVYQAQGMTMVDLGIPLADALARLRAHAYAQDRTLTDVARDIVEGRLRLEPEIDDR